MTMSDDVRERHLKLLHTADLHVGNGRFGAPHRRLNDIVDVMDRFIAEAENRRVDLAVIAGDLFDNRRPHPRDWAAVASFITNLSKVCPVVITDGNHDGAQTIGDEQSRTLLALRETDWSNRVVVSLSPDVISFFSDQRPPFQVVTVPYPHKRLLDADPALENLAPIQRMEAVAKNMDEGLRALHDRARAEMPDAPVILVAHLTAAGSTVGSERGMRLEDDITISADVLDLFDYCALGHIHKQQRVSDKAWYAGAPLNISFGEAGDTKGFLEVTVSAVALPTVVSVPSGEGPLIDLTRTPRTIRQEELRGAYIKRYAGFSGALRDEELYGYGARYVENVYRPTEKEAPASDRAIDTATSPATALLGWLNDHRPDFDEKQREAVLATAREIMEDS
jgi:exonuclease SbcD